MAINLSANTKTTEALSQEVFDPNIGFKSGLQELAQGVSQAGAAAGKLANKIHTKKVNVNKSLASTNSTVYQTQMDTDFRTLQSVLKDPNATEEAISAAEVAVAQYETIGYSNIDKLGEVPEDYYSNYLPTLQARYKAHLADVEIVKESKKQLKVVHAEIAGADYTNDALVGAPSSQYVRDSVTAIRSTFSPNSGSSIEALNDRTASDKELFTALKETLDTTLLKLPELDVDKQIAELDLLEQEILRLSDSANLNEDIKANPVLAKFSNDALAKIANAKSDLGKAGDEKRQLAKKASDARVINNVEVAAVASQNATNPVTGVYTPSGKAMVGIAEAAINGLSSEANESDINKLNSALIEVLVRGAQVDFTEDGPVKDTDISYIGGALKTFIETGTYNIDPEAFIIRGVDGKILADRSALLKDADTQEQLIGLVTEELNLIKSGLAAGDFSVLARIDGAYGKAWKTVNDLTVDVNTRAAAWEKLNSISEAYRRNSAYTELFAGVQGFAVMPDRGKVAFSELSSSEKLNYVDEFIALNGSEASVRAAIAALSYSNNDSSVIGVLAGMRLENNGSVEKALSYLDISTDMYSGLALTTEKGGERTLNAAAPSVMYEKIVSIGGTTPFGIERLAAQRSNNPALAKMYQDIELGMIASSMLTASPNVTAEALLKRLMKDQKEFLSDNTLLTQNGSVVKIPELDYNNKYQKAIKSVEPKSYELGSKQALKEALIAQKIPASARLQLAEYAKDNLAMAGAFSADTLSREEEIDKYVEALFEYNEYTDTHPMVDLSKIHTIDGVDYVIPRFLNGDIYQDLILESGKPFMYPVNNVHKKVYDNRLLIPYEELDLTKSEDREIFRLKQLVETGSTTVAQSMQTGGFY